MHYALQLWRLRYNGPGHYVLTLPILATLLISMFCPPVVQAAGGEAQFGLKPVFYDPSDPVTASYFIFNARPGSIIHSEVRVINSGTATGAVSLYAVDATTGQTSGTVFLSRQAPRQDVGAWVTLGTQQLTLAPGQSQIVPFRVAIPDHVRSGQHVGGIVAENMALEMGPKKGAIQINIKHLTIIAVQINLPGPAVEQLEATGIQPGGINGYQILQLGLRNTGTVMLKPVGTLQVIDAQGQIVQRIPLKLDTFLPQTTIDYPVFITGRALGVGHYQAILTMNYGNHHTLSYTAAFAIAPAQILQMFHQPPPLAPPALSSSGNLILWQVVAGVLIAMLVILGALYWRSHGWRKIRR